MSKDFGNHSIDSIADAGEQQVQVNVDEANAPVTYSSTVRVSGSPEEITLDFAGPIRPTGARTATLKIDQRIILNPWAAKRLAQALVQAVSRYEQTYGQLELDPRKRLVNPQS